MPSIFEQLTDTNRSAQKATTVNISLRLKERLHRVGQQLVAKRNWVSASLLLLLLAWLWLNNSPVNNANGSAQQALVLPIITNNSVTGIKPEPALTEKPITLNTNATTSQTESVKSLFYSAQESAHVLGAANQKAIELALAGKASQATTILEQALLSDPQAGLVFENLRRLYAGFASQSYQLALEPNKPKEIMVELANADKNISIKLDAPSYILVDSKTTKVQKEPTTITSNTPKNTTPATEPALASRAEMIEPAPMPVVKVNTTVVSEPTPAQKEAAQRKANLQALQHALKHWSDAWSKQDVKGYFASYAPTYSPKNTTRKAWMDYRQERILAPKRIKIELSDVKIVLIKPNLARISFTQSYTSDTLSARDQKSLEFELINQLWLITNESGR